MCVRDLRKGKCQGSRRMNFKESLRRPNKAPSKPMSSASASRRGGGSNNRMKRKEEIDLLCTELLSNSNAHSGPWTADLPFSELGADSSLASPTASSDFSFASSPGVAMDPCAYDYVSESSIFDLYDDGSPWVGPVQMDDSPPALWYVEESPEGIKDTSHGVQECHYRLDDNGKKYAFNRGVGWHDSNSDPRLHQLSSSLLPGGGDAQSGCQSLALPTAAPCLHSGNSYQSKQLLAYSTRPAQICPSFHVGKELQCKANDSQFDHLSSIKEPEFDVIPDHILAICAAGDPRLKSLSSHDANFGSSKSRARISSHSAETAASDLRFRLEFREAMELLRNKETSGRYELSASYVEGLNVNGSASPKPGGVLQLSSVRRSFVEWILRIVELLCLSTMTAARAVSLFDRNLFRRVGGSSAQDNEDELEELLLIAVACVWIASKLEDSGTPQLSCIRQVAGIACDDEKIRKMEVSVMKSLGWRMLGVTAGDFLGSMLAHLPVLGLPVNLLPILAHGSEEILRRILPEVEFLVYQPSVLSFGIMQFILDECIPSHTSMLMAAFHRALVVDMEAKEECCRKLISLPMDNTATSNPPPNSNLGRGNLNYGLYQLSSNSDPDGLLVQNSRPPIPAF